MTKMYDAKMHTAEHLLNQTMVRTFDCGRCFSAHINKKKSKCDYKFSKPLSQEEILTLEENINEVILKDIPVTIEHMPEDQAKKEFNIDRVPGKDDLKGFRIVRIGNYDACPCIGPHVSSTSEIGQFKITTSGFENGVLRIRFKLL